jgi:hypothetical protein
MDITKELLRKMAKEERCLFLTLGHASNQMNALWRLVIILTNGDETDPVKQRLEGAQAQIFVRLTHRRDAGGLEADRGAVSEETLGSEISAAARCGHDQSILGDDLGKMPRRWPNRPTKRAA